jgi:hypothetical protein
MLAVVKTAEPQLTGVKAELVQRVAAHEAAMSAVALAWQPEQRLSAVVHEHEAAEAELAARKAEHMVAIRSLKRPRHACQPFRSRSIAAAPTWAAACSQRLNLTSGFDHHRGSSISGIGAS